MGFHSGPFFSLEDVQKAHRSGYAVKHCPTPLYDEDFYFTWHPTRQAANRCLSNLWPVADERVVKIEETETWRRERKRLRLMRILNRLKASGVPLSGQSSSSA